MASAEKRLRIHHGQRAAGSRRLPGFEQCAAGDLQTAIGLPLQRIERLPRLAIGVDDMDALGDPAVGRLPLAKLETPVAIDRRVAVLVVEEYKHRESGEVLRIERISMYDIEDGKLKSMTVRDRDQYASDEFWTRTAS